MARMPGAVWQGEQSPRTPMSRYDAVCVHTIVGYAPAHAAHFSVKADGTIIQSRDTRYRSGANLDGNHRIISVENEDHGSAFGAWNTRDGHAVPDFTAAQIEANARILAWAHKTHGVPLQLCPDSRPSSRGLAYHRQGINGNWSGYRFPGRVSGGEIWTTSPGKVCPGDRRIARRQQILDRAKQIVGGGPPKPPEQEDDMPPYRDWSDADKKALKDDLVEGILSARIDRFNGKNKVRIDTILGWIYRDGQRSLPGKTAEAVWGHRAKSYISGKVNSMRHALLYTQESAQRLRDTDVVERPEGGASSFAYAIGQLRKRVEDIAQKGGARSAAAPAEAPFSRASADVDPSEPLVEDYFDDDDPDDGR